MRLKVLVVTWLLATSVAVASSTPAPVLFFSDLILGANTGNSDTTYSSTGGVYVTLYGNYLTGETSVTLGGASCLTVVSAPATYLWYQRMIVKVGTSCTSGNWGITTPGGTWSGPMLETTKEGRSTDFTVVSGHIYYVATSGSNSNSGSFSSPWAGADHAECSMADGDVTYLENGYTDTSTDGCAGDYGIISPTSSTCASSTSSQRALVGYPGATATLGSTSSSNEAFINYSMPCDGYELAELTLRSANVTLQPLSANNAGGSGTCPSSCSQNMRFVGLDLSCPNPTIEDQDGCLQDSGAAGGDTDPTYNFNIVFNGIYIHDTGSTATLPPSETLYHSEYHGAVKSVIEAWGYTNPTLGNVSGAGVCDAIQYYSSVSGSIFQTSDVHIHDMMISGSGCSGILMANNLQASSGATLFGGGIELYNNVIWAAGTTSNDPQCVDFAGFMSGTVQFYNNTLYNCGPGVGEYSSGFITGYYANAGSSCTTTTSCVTNANNNIIYQTLGYYIYNVDPTGTGSPNTNGSASQITGANNDLYGIGAISSSTVGGGYWSVTGSLNSNPSFVNTSSSPPSLAPSSASSPVVGAGSDSKYSTYDINGLLRPNPPSIGAYEYAAATSDPPPSAPTGLTAVVQ